LAKRLHADFHEWKEEVKCLIYPCNVTCLFAQLYVCIMFKPFKSCGNK
jgi:hypothetical protein